MKPEKNKRRRTRTRRSLTCFTVGCSWKWKRKADRSNQIRLFSSIFLPSLSGKLNGRWLKRTIYFSQRTKRLFKVELNYHSLIFNQIRQLICRFFSWWGRKRLRRIFSDERHQSNLLRWVFLLRFSNQHRTFHYARKSFLNFHFHRPISTSPTNEQNTFDIWFAFL